VDTCCEEPKCNKVKIEGFRGRSECVRKNASMNSSLDTKRSGEGFVRDHLSLPIGGRKLD